MSEVPSPIASDASDTGVEKPGKRKVSILLGIGILFIPYVFSWFLLRKGHSKLSRIVGFSWLVLILLVAMTPKASGPATPEAAVNAAVSGKEMAAQAPPTAERTPEQTAAELEAAKERAAAKEKEAAYRAIRRDPEDSLSLQNVKGRKDGFGTVLMIGGTINNSSDYDIKDPRIRCELSGPSGTTVGSVRETLYEVVPAKGSKRFRELNMGFLSSSQVSRFVCEIVDATVVEP